MIKDLVELMEEIRMSYLLAKGFDMTNQDPESERVERARIRRNMGYHITSKYSLNRKVKEQ